MLSPFWHHLWCLGPTLFRKLINYHQKDHLSLFIEIVFCCSELNDFTSAYLLYSIIKEYEQENRGIFRKILQSIENGEKKWNGITDLFCIIKNYNNYRMTYQSIGSTTPRIPLMFVLFQDLKMISKLPTIDEIHGLLNVEKLKHFREIIETIVLVKLTSYHIVENQAFQFFFSNV